jgi:hypothetical protein
MHEQKRWAKSLGELRLEKLTHPSLTGPLRFEWKEGKWSAAATVDVNGGKTMVVRMHDDGRLERISQ